MIDHLKVDELDYCLREPLFRDDGHYFEAIAITSRREHVLDGLLNTVQWAYKSQVPHINIVRSCIYSL